MALSLVFFLIHYAGESQEFRNYIRDNYSGIDIKVLDFIELTFGADYIVADSSQKRLEYPYPFDYLYDMYSQIMLKNNEEFHIISHKKNVQQNPTIVLVQSKNEFMHGYTEGKEFKKVCLGLNNASYIDSNTEDSYEILVIESLGIYLGGFNLNTINTFQYGACK